MKLSKGEYFLIKCYFDRTMAYLKFMYQNPDKFSSIMCSNYADDVFKQLMKDLDIEVDGDE